ncbi:MULTISPECIES: hypothetical protein [Deinococcus]|uniref:C-type lysozyme inhibitor domain-containing protein n=1 Tax=Deinococcus rufus TaxID=2136097 RepID=A0ABV7ZD68_9DEIO|nr:hypothetical protein [Deinococcus sp. AB2017081]WQE94890.1 hypothetical protein U2P90_16090 [Deinococcus sp. AB2017081]
MSFPVLTGSLRRAAAPLSIAVSSFLGTVGLGTAGADGMAAASVTYVCQGGVRVQVRPMGDTAVVTFAGATTTLSLTPGGSFRNAQVTWATQGEMSTLRDNATGRLRLTGCRPLR